MKSRTGKGFVGLLVAVALVLVGWAAVKSESQDQAQPKNQMQITKAVAVLHPTEGNKVSGLVTFMKVEGGIHVTAHVEGLTAGPHGFHIHTYGDCSAPDGKSAGGHFNPENMSHGAPDAEKRHVGDLGNITAGDSGHTHLDRIDSHLALNGPNSIIGRGVIIHAKADDFTSQPTGAAGARVACGVIGIAKE